MKYYFLLIVTLRSFPPPFNMKGNALTLLTQRPYCLSRQPSGEKLDSSVEVGCNGFSFLSPVSPDLCDLRHVTYLAQSPFSYLLCDTK